MEKHQWTLATPAKKINQLNPAQIAKLFTKMLVVLKLCFGMFCKIAIDSQPNPKTQILVKNFGEKYSNNSYWCRNF